MKMFCHRCNKEVIANLMPRIVPINKDLLKNPDSKMSPKNNVMIKAICSECDKYINFMPQTPEVVYEVNKNMDAIFEKRFTKLTINDTIRLS